jgi:hypothetical protein
VRRGIGPGAHQIDRRLPGVHNGFAMTSV